jgi:hypothetical protein
MADDANAHGTADAIKSWPGDSADGERAAPTLGNHQKLTSIAVAMVGGIEALKKLEARLTGASQQLTEVLAATDEPLTQRGEALAHAAAALAGIHRDMLAQLCATASRVLEAAECAVLADAHFQSRLMAASLATIARTPCLVEEPASALAHIAPPKRGGTAAGGGPAASRRAVSGATATAAAARKRQAEPPASTPEEAAPQRKKKSGDNASGDSA